jgi:hypothetical protein
VRLIVFAKNIQKLFGVIQGTEADLHPEGDRVCTYKWHQKKASGEKLPAIPQAERVPQSELPQD